MKRIFPTYREPPPPSASKPPPLLILPPFSIGRRRIGVCTDLSETSQSRVSVNNLQFFMKRILYHSCLHLNYLLSLWDNSLNIGLKTHKTRNTGRMSRSKWSLGGGGAGGNRCKRRLALFYKHFERHTGVKDGCPELSIVLANMSIIVTQGATRRVSQEILSYWSQPIIFRAIIRICTNHWVWVPWRSLLSHTVMYDVKVSNNRFQNRFFGSPTFYASSFSFSSNNAFFITWENNIEKPFNRMTKSTHLVWRALLSNGIALLQSHSWWRRHLVGKKDYTSKFVEEVLLWNINKCC